MARKKQNVVDQTENTEVQENEVVETSATDETTVTEDVAAPEVTQEPGEPVSTDVNPEGVAIEPSTEGTENIEVTVDTQAPEGTVEVPATETPAADETTEQPATEDPVAPASNDETSTPAANDDEDEGPADELKDDESDEVPATDPKILADAEMKKTYKVRYAFDMNMKRVAVLKTMTLKEIYRYFVTQRTAFVGLTNMADYNAIAKAFATLPMEYNTYPIVSLAKTQFLSRLRTNTEYAVVRWRY